MSYTSPSLQCVTIVAIPQDNMASLKPLQEGAVVLHILVADSGLRRWRERRVSLLLSHDTLLVQDGFWT